MLFNDIMPCFSSVIDVVTTISSVTLATLLVPGVPHQLTVLLSLTNNNQPDANFDVASVDAATSGVNFNVSMRVVDVNMSRDDVIGYELDNFSMALTYGNESAALSSTDSLLLTYTIDVSNCGSRHTTSFGAWAS